MVPVAVPTGDGRGQAILYFVSHSTGDVSSAAIVGAGTSTLSVIRKSGPGPEADSGRLKRAQASQLVSGPKGMYETCLTLFLLMVDINMKSC